MRRTLLLVAVLALLAVLVRHAWRRLDALRPPLPAVRALWVTRFDYASADDVRRMVRNVAEAGFTDVFFQVRGNGTAYYRSALEPWAFELSGHAVSALGTDPGWDPLQLAIDTARPHGLRIHAYINVLPGWKGLAEPPPPAGQLWTAHPDWFMVDSLGQKMLPTSGWYAFVNPVLPEVRDHLRGIVAELCAYEVDGIHLDYIRYPYDYRFVARQRYPDADDAELARRADFSYDPASQAALFDRYGWNVSKERITAFRCESVTRLVREISRTMQERKPGACVLSASVLANPVEARHAAFQDSAAWARQGIVDWTVQMNYGSRAFKSNLEAMRREAGRRAFGRSVVVGLYAKNDEADLARQFEEVRASGCRGVAVFSYGLLFDKQHRPTEKGARILEMLRRAGASS